MKSPVSGKGVVSKDTQKELNRRAKREYRELNAASTSFTSSFPRAEKYVQDEYIRCSIIIDRSFDIPHLCKVVGMGNNESSQLGFEVTENNSNIPPTLIPICQPIRMVKAGGLHSVALSASGVPYSWGSNDDGTLGRPTTDVSQETRPLPITGFVRSHDFVSEDDQIMQIALGDSHSLFLSLSGNVYQCGMYKDMDSGVFSDIDGRNGSPLGGNTKPVHVFQLSDTVTEIYAGGGYNAALLADHTIVTWGMYFV
jgi:alpha-tubulin suppressor-like RCC1 family protein